MTTSSLRAQPLFADRPVEDLGPVDRALLARNWSAESRAVAVAPLDRARSAGRQVGYAALLNGEQLELLPSSFTCQNADCSSYSLSGNVGQFGTFTLSHERGRGTSGAITGAKATYLLTAISKTAAVLKVQLPEVVDANHLPEVCALEGVGLDEDSHDIELQSRSTPTNCVLDVLDVLTPEATSEVNARPQYPTSVTEFVNAIHGRLSQTVGNSGLGGQKTARSTFITNTTIPGVSTSCYSGIDQLESSPTAQSLRRQYDADVLAYYPQGRLSGCSGIAGGIGGNYGDAYTLNSVRDELDGYAFTVINTHEVGHVIGGSHGRAHLFNNSFGTQYNTQMRSTIPVPYTLPYYSNPNVSIYDPYIGLYNVPTGTSSKNNALYIANEYCQTAAFKNAGSTTADIQVGYTEDCGTILLTPLVYAGSNGGPDGGPYTYLWQHATDPYGPRTTFSSSASMFPFFKPYGSFTNTYYVFLTISNSSGFSYQTTDVVTFCGSGGPYYMSDGSGAGTESETRPAIRSAIALQGRIATMRAIIDADTEASEVPTSVEWTVSSSDGVLVFRSGRADLTADQIVDLAGVAAGVFHVTLASMDGAPLSTTSVIIN